MQRVSEARVVVEAGTVSSIGRGLLVFLGIEKGDTDKDLEYIVRKILNLRVFEDADGRMNLSLRETKGEVLLVSQFTLPADCRRGNRPSFDRAEVPDRAERMYHKACGLLEDGGIGVQTGVFGALMQVHLVNEGPVTFMLDTKASSML